MNMEHPDVAAAACVIALSNVLNGFKIKESIPPKIRYFISFVVWGAGLWWLFRVYRAWVLQDGWGKVLLVWVGGVVVLVGISVIVAKICKICASIWKKSTDDAIDP